VENNEPKISGIASCSLIILLASLSWAVVGVIVVTVLKVIYRGA